MLNCKDASELMSHDIDASLSFGKRLSLRLHLIMCHGCSNFFKQLQFLNQAARHWRNRNSNAIPRLSDEAKQRIAQALQERYPNQHSSRKQK